MGKLAVQKRRKVDPVNRALATIPSFTGLKGLTRLILDNKHSCKQCGQRRINMATSIYLGNQTDACDECESLKEEISELIKKGFGSEPDLYQKRVLINAMRGIANFGIRRPFVLGVPILVVWEYTSECNLGSCKHCYTDSSRFRKDGSGELTTGEAKAAVDQFAGSGVSAIAFTGGESLIRDDFLEIAAYAKSLGIVCYLATNGSLLTKEKVKEIKDSGVCLLHISLDAANASAHDAFRNAPGLFDKAIQGIRNSLDEGLEVIISATATQETYTEIPKIMDLGDRLGADWLIVYNFVPTGRGDFGLDLNAGQKEWLHYQLLRKSKHTRHMGFTSFAPQAAMLPSLTEGSGEILPTHYYDPTIGLGCQSLLKLSGGCMAGTYYLGMDPKGNLKPCTFLPVHIGNIREKELTDVWENSLILKQIRERDKYDGACGQCEYGSQCGGCRARAYAYTGDYLGSDPGCFVQGGAVSEEDNLVAMASC